MGVDAEMVIRGVARTRVTDDWLTTLRAALEKLRPSLVTVIQRSVRPPIHLVRQWADVVEDALRALQGRGDDGTLSLLPLRVMAASKRGDISDELAIDILDAIRSPPAAEEWVAWKPGDAIPSPGRYRCTLQSKHGALYDEKVLTIHPGMTQWNLSTWRVIAYLPTPLPAPYLPPPPRDKGEANE